MFDNYYTKYKYAKDFINSKTAREIADRLEIDIKFHKMSAEKYAYLSKAYVYLEEPRKALNAAKNSVKLDKNYAYGYVRLAFAYGKEGRKKEALKAILKAEEFGQDDWFICSFLVAIFSWLEEDEKCDFYLQKLVDFNLNTPEYNYAVGFAYAQGRAKDDSDYEKAIEYFTRAQDFKNYYDLIYKTMIAYGKIGDDYNAELYMNKCLAYGETEDLLERKISLYLWKNNPDEIIADIRRYYKLTCDKRQALIYFAAAFKQKYEYKKALKYLKFAELTTGATAFLYEKFAEIYEALEDYDNALYYSKQSLKLDKNQEDVLLNISFYYSKLKQNELAELYVDKVLLLNPESAYPYYRKGNLLCEMNDYEDACKMYKKASEKDPSDVDYYSCISFAYSKLGKHELSLEYANRGLMVNKNDYYTHFRKGWALQELGKYAEAVKSFEKCIELNESYIDAYADISYCCSKTGDMKKSILYANKAMLINKDYAYAHYRKAWALAYDGKFMQAKDFFESAIELDPTDTYSYIGLAATSISTNDAQKALNAANKAIFLDRNCGEAYYFKGAALSTMGKAKEAEKYYAMALKLGYT